MLVDWRAGGPNYVRVTATDRFVHFDINSVSG
jgi:hypothetical protein